MCSDDRAERRPASISLWAAVFLILAGGVLAVLLPESAATRAGGDPPVELRVAPPAPTAEWGD